MAKVDNSTKKLSKKAKGRKRKHESNGNDDAVANKSVIIDSAGI